MEQLPRRVAQMAREHALWVPGDRILVALSGGPDSTALLHLLLQLAPAEGLTITAAHVDHGLRGKESAAEAEAAGRLCRLLGVEVQLLKADVSGHMTRTGLGVQTAARELRYARLHEAAARCGASRVALGHQADDQAETVLMRMLRGSGLGGLSGIPVKRREKNVELIRPLLRITKAELIAYCQTAGLAYSTDSSNAKPDYIRNAIRLEALPQLRRFNPRLDATLARTAEVAAAEDAYMEARTAELFKAHVHAVDGGYKASHKALLALPLALQRRLIKLILSYLSREKNGIAFEHVEAIRAAMCRAEPTTWRLDAVDGIRCMREYDTMKWVRPAEQPGPYTYVVPRDGGELKISEAGIALQFALVSGAAPARPDRREAWFDPAQLHLPLQVRSRRAGDRMAVAGLKGTKKVQDMFVDEKVPAARRARWPLLCDGRGELLWIPGLRRSALAAPAGAGPYLRVRALAGAADDGMESLFES
ncbi:tRNA lysidine(34) synthetase TilS [Paenibacillus sp. IB182496]|uniref:tRNA(Ile)-lysidine synthase n=1 Tax=Paenibacillus sabuli TaxID=2772509 RepID=A0A927BWZ0_9BACL|nr:tRNA lysidine(34) synthetase TilS [Paenibacillus sabuli]MBD2848413.1 tRNA lysidine(34) synthetase TilS [Paenibacillus sabuli]